MSICRWKEGIARVESIQRKFTPYLHRQTTGQVEAHPAYIDRYATYAPDTLEHRRFIVDSEWLLSRIGGRSRIREVG